MLESLKNIRNPLARGATAGLTVSALVTMLSAVIIGVTAPKNESLYKISVYTSVIAAIGGGVFGLLTDRSQGQSTREIPAQLATSQTESTQWKDWRNFVVVRKVTESQEITSSQASRSRENP